MLFTDSDTLAPHFLNPSEASEFFSDILCLSACADGVDEEVYLPLKEDNVRLREQNERIQKLNDIRKTVSMKQKKEIDQLRVNVSMLKKENKKLKAEKEGSAFGSFFDWSDWE